jgi:hypothetical protein
VASCTVSSTRDEDQDESRADLVGHGAARARILGHGWIRGLALPEPVVVTMEKLSKAQIACLKYLHEHPGATYDKIPFRDSTFRVLGRLGMVHNHLMMPTISRVGLLAIGKS